MAADKPKNALSGIEWIDTDPLYICIGQELQKSSPVGEDLEDNDRFDEIMSEMMKRGTLNHSTIRWDWVCDGSVALLINEAKDFRLLFYMLLCLPHLKKYEDPMTLGVFMTARFIDLWGEKAFPLKKKRLPILRNIVEALDQIIDASLKQDQGKAHIAAVSEKLRECAAFLDQYDETLGTKLKSLGNRVEVSVLEDDENGLPSIEKIIKQPVQSKPIIEVKEKADSSRPTIELHPENLTLDSRNERGLKQSLNSVADFILNFDVTNPLAYRLRRFSTWFGIQNPPEQRKKDNPKTVIQPVAPNALEEYRIAAERGRMDTEIVQKLERSCNIQPFWIEGQYLAFKLAMLCNRKLAAEAILDETYRFYSKYDWLNHLQFSDETPFVPAEVKNWLSSYKRSGGGDVQSQDSEMISSEMQQIVRNAREKAKQGQINEAITLLETSNPIGDSPRSKTIWEMLMMECLSEWGMTGLVEIQAKRLEKDIAEMQVQDFEPELLTRLGHLVTSSK